MALQMNEAETTTTSLLKSSSAPYCRSTIAATTSFVCSHGQDFTPSFSPSVLPFSHMNEDYNAEMEALDSLHLWQLNQHAIIDEKELDGEKEAVKENLSGESLRKMRVLTIASSGETALSLLSRSDVATIDAVDLNPWQAHMSELRRTALLHLSRDDQLRLFGMHPGHPLTTDTEARKILYTEHVRPHLPAATRDAWDSRLLREIAFGLGHSGQSEIINHDIQHALHHAGLDPLAGVVYHMDIPQAQMSTKPGKLSITRQSQARERASLAADPAMLAAFRSVYCYENFRRRFAQLHINEAAMEEMIHRHLEVLSRPNIEENYFFRYYYSNYHDFENDAGMPLYLQNTAQETIRRLGADKQRLRIHNGDVITLANDLTHKHNELFDLISISNILDWIPENEAASFVAALWSCLRPGGIVLVRHETKTPDYLASIARQLNDSKTSTTPFTFDAKFNARLLRAERSLLRRDVAAFIRPVA